MRQCLQDDLQRDVSFPFPPRRVVSLCPSLTETLFALGLDEGTVVGRTEYCVHPAGRVRNVATVGGTQTIDTQRVRTLRPDLVIASKDENSREAVEALSETLAVFVFDVRGFEDALRAISRLGELTDCTGRAQALAGEIRAAFATLRSRATRRVAYLIWKDRYRAVGRDTYIDSLLHKCGFKNVCAPLAGRYPELSLDTLRDLRPEWVFLSSEPYPFDESHAAQLAARLTRTRVIRVDGEMFGWYGSRMLAAADYLKRLAAELDDAAPGSPRA
jgi:ABC-type Fe3+-hydroxamate transport system substrate-binding protein